MVSFVLCVVLGNATKVLFHVTVMSLDTIGEEYFKMINIVIYKFVSETC